jgi:hypothetical protein
MSISSRLLLGAAYVIIAVYLVLPFVTGENHVSHPVRQFGGLAFPLIGLVGVAVQRPRALLYTAAAINAVVAVVSGVGLTIQALSVGFGPLISNDIPAIAFFILIVPAIAAYAFKPAAADCANKTPASAA